MQYSGKIGIRPKFDRTNFNFQEGPPYLLVLRSRALPCSMKSLLSMGGTDKCAQNGLERCSQGKTGLQIVTMYGLIDWSTQWSFLEAHYKAQQDPDIQTSTARQLQASGRQS